MLGPLAVGTAGLDGDVVAMGKSMIEIGVLGELTVRRADGSSMDAGEWRTGKAADLLRLLALEAGKPVRISTLLEKLWPDVDESRGRASLRTAASAVRRALQADCIERELNGVVLRGVRVDVDDFRTAVLAARTAIRDRSYETVLENARAAETLYRGEFRAHNDDSDWAYAVRTCLGKLRQDLLADAVDAALETRAWDEAVDLATRAVEVDPTSERAHRALMRGYAGLGEFDQALRVFERCRRMLAEELGVDPAPRTVQVHTDVLAAGARVAPAEKPFATVPRTARRPRRVHAQRNVRGSTVPAADVVQEQVRSFLRSRYPGLDFEIGIACATAPTGLAG